MRQRAVSIALATLAALASLSTLRPVSAQETENIRIVGQIGGRCRVVDVQGDYAYVSEGQKMAVVDVSDSTRPQIVSRTAFPWIVEGIHASGTYVHVLGEGLNVVDVGDPREPVVCGETEVPGTIAYFGDLHGDGDLLCVTTRDVVQAFDVSDPSSPTRMGDYQPYPSFLVSGVHVADNLAYIAGENGGLHIVDFGDPTTSVVMSVTSMPDRATGIFVSSQTAYVACSWAGLQLVDVTNRSSPSLRGRCPLLHEAEDVYVVDGKACVNAVSKKWMSIVDVSDASSPVLRATYKHVFEQRRRGLRENCCMDSAGHWAYLPAGEDGLLVLDVRDPSRPALSGVYDVPTEAISVAVERDVAYVLSGEHYGALVAIDVSNPLLPRQYSSHFPIPVPFHKGLFVADGLAYVTGIALLHIFSVSDPYNMYPVGSDLSPTRGNEVFVSGSIAYVADLSWVGRLQIVDVSSPWAPLPYGDFATSEPAWSVDVDAGFAYVGCGTLISPVFYDPAGTLEIVDVRNPSVPVRKGIYPLGGHVDVSGNNAYIGTESRGLDILDVSDPSSPTLVGTWKGEGGPVHVVNALAYVVHERRGLRILDVTNPAKPVQVASFDHRPQDLFYYLYTDVAVAGGLIYLAGGADGLWILEYVPGPRTSAERWALYGISADRGDLRLLR